MKEVDLRYERKFRIEGLSLSSVQQIIRQHPAAFRIAYPDRQVNSIYLDNLDLNNWKENVLGWNERKKYRIRWYGENLEQAEWAKLEIKSKHNELGWKEYLDIGDFELTHLRLTLDEIRSQKPELNNQVAQLFNSYLRSYFISFDQRFRLTLDRGMRFYRLRDSNFALHKALGDAAFILELKYAKEWDDQLDLITSHLPFRQTKHSKYVQGLKLIS